MAVRYKVYAALAEDIDKGHVWVGMDNDGINNFSSREIVFIRNGDKKIHCELLKIDRNFRRKYNMLGKRRKKIIPNKNVIVIGEYYRRKLGITETQKFYPLVISMGKFPLWIEKILACLVDHPQLAIRVATRLGIISLGLGVISFILAISPFLDNLTDCIAKAICSKR